MSLKQDLHNHGEKTRAGITKKDKQLHMRDSFKPKHREEITP